MTLSGLSVKRKIAMGCFIAMLVYFGALSYFKVGMDTLPKMDVPYVQVLTIYPGASPEEVETDVAKRIDINSPAKLFTACGFPSRKS